MTLEARTQFSDGSFRHFSALQVSGHQGAPKQGHAGGRSLTLLSSWVIISASPLRFLAQSVPFGQATGSVCAWIYSQPVKGYRRARPLNTLVLLHHCSQGPESMLVGIDEWEGGLQVKMSNGHIHATSTTSDLLITYSVSANQLQPKSVLDLNSAQKYILTMHLFSAQIQTHYS